MLKGIDISEYQQTVDYSRLKNAVDFVIIRASYGNGYTDRFFTQNRDVVRNNNIPHGFYHYAYPQYNQPQNEANWFLQTVAVQTGELLCLDFEEHWSGDPVNWCKVFLDTVSANLNGYKPLVYLNLSLINNHDWSPVINAGYGLWLADWDNNPTGAGHNTPWSVTAIRQYTDAAQISGVIGNVDADIFYGDLTAFSAYGYNTQVPQPNNNLSSTLNTPTSNINDQTLVNLGPDLGYMDVQTIKTFIPNPKSTNTNPQVSNGNSSINQQPQDSVLPSQISDNGTILQKTTNQIFLDSLKSRKFILSVLASAVAFLNSKFNLGLSQEQLILFLLPIIIFIIVEGIADIFGRSQSNP